MKKAWSRAAAILLAMSMLTACSEGKEPVSTVSSEAGSSSAAEVSTPEDNGEPVELSYLAVLPPEVTSHMKSYDESHVFQTISEKLNIKFTFVHPTEEQRKQQINLLTASHQLPDIVENFEYEKGLDQAVEDGVIFDVTDDLAEMAPDYKKLLDEDTEIRKQVLTEQGKVASFNMVQTIDEPPWQGLIIRQDLLEKYNLSMPETISDWDNVLRTFKANGVEYPLYFSFDKRYVTPDLMGGIGQFVSAYGIGPAWFKTGESGKETVKYGPYEDAYKDFLTLIAGWYKDGLIDPDAFSRDEKSKDALILQGKIAVSTSGYGPARNYNDNAKANGDETFNMQPVKNPSLNPGETVHFRNTNFKSKGCPTVISTNCKNYEKAMEFLNFGYTAEGSRLYSFGLEGEVYELKDGRPSYLPIYTKGKDGVPFVNLKEIYLKVGGPFIREDSLYLQPEYSQNAMKVWGGNEDDMVMPMISRSPEESERYSVIMNDVDSYVREMGAKFIMGSTPLDQFGEFQAQLKNMKIEEAIAIQQAALDRYNAK